MLWYISCIPGVSRKCIMMRCWILPKVFSASNEIKIGFVSLTRFMLWIMFIEVYMLTHPYMSEMTPYWLWWIIFMNCSWICLHLFYWGYSYLCSQAILFYNSLFYCIFIWFWYHGTTSIIKNIIYEIIWEACLLAILWSQVELCLFMIF